MRIKFHPNLLIILLLSIFACTLEEKTFDNPVDIYADETPDPPYLSFFPRAQTTSVTAVCSLGAYIVFDSIETHPFAGVHLNIEFDASILEIDTLLPGWIGPGSMTDSNQTTPLFTYTLNEGTLDIFTYYLDTEETSIDSLTHVAEILFNPLQTGITEVQYDTTQCEVIQTDDTIIQIQGTGSAEITVQ